MLKVCDLRAGYGGEPVLQGVHERDLRRILGDQRLGHQVGELGDEDLLRAVAHPEGIIHHQSAGMVHFQQMRRGDIAHVKGRVLPQPDHIEFGQIDIGPIAECHMIARLAAQGDGTAARDDAPFDIAQLVGRILKQAISARLGFKAQAERAVPIDRNMLDRVHLKGDVKAHDPNPGLFQTGF